MKIGNITPPSVEKTERKSKVDMPPKSFASVMKEAMKADIPSDSIKVSEVDVKRAAKVDEIKQKVQAGTYKVNYKEVAKAILKKLNL